MIIEKSVIDGGLHLLHSEGDLNTKFVTWSVCLTFSQEQHHLNQWVPPSRNWCDFW